MPTPSLFYREIPLTQGQVSLVDVEDYERLSKHNWHADWNPHTQSFYARCWTPYVAGKRVRIFMAREILGLQKGDKRKADHENHNTLDNRRSNLRIATNFENAHNRRNSANNTSGYKGVSQNGRTGKWQAYIYLESKQIHLGFFPSAEEAHAAYCAAATRLHGEFARAA